MNESVKNDIVDPSISIDNLYPTLLQCFVIITIGYIAGRLNLILNTEAKGLNTFVGNFALPSLIFLSLAKLNWSVVNWKFLESILISKSIVFLSVICIAILVIKPINLGRAGVLAIFCTQSNDFAIGYPIVAALYKDSHPEFSQYIYLMAPISLAILNPIGYVLMEVSKAKNKEEDDNSSPTTPRCLSASPTQNLNHFWDRKIVKILKTVLAIFINPILLMTLMGVAAGFIFKGGLPITLEIILDAFGKSFSSASLFLLGLRMVGISSTFQGEGYILPGILILVKLLVLPVITRQTVNIINPGANATETTDLSTFAFLYGTFPAAPGVFVVASQYNLDVDLIASSMVASTFISAPLMFISAKMIAIHDLNPSDYMNEFDKFSFEISVLAIISSVYLLVIFGFSRKYQNMPHRITCCLIISQLLECIGVILWSTLGQKTGWRMVIQFCFFTIGGYSSRLWTAILAITLLFLQCRSLCFVLKLWPTFLLVGWGIPTIVTSLLLIFDPSSNVEDKRNPSFQYGNAQAAISVFILVMCFIVIFGCLVLHQRYKRVQEKYDSLSREVSEESREEHPETNLSTTNLIEENDNSSIRVVSNNLTESETLESSDDENTGTQCRDFENSCGNSSGCCSVVKTVVDIEDVIPRPRNSINNEDERLCSLDYNCSGQARQNCKSTVEKYTAFIRDGLDPIEMTDNVDLHQTTKHIMLLILLLCSMFVGLALSIWTLVMEGMSGIYVEMSFLDAFLNFGQSLIVLAIFMGDSSELFKKLKIFWIKLFYGSDDLVLPKLDELTQRTKHLCDQFKKYHLERCRREIAKDKRWRMQIYRKVFYGSTFVDWMIEVGLAQDRTEAVIYGKALLDGRVIRHVHSKFHFQDKMLLYSFCGLF